MAPFQSIPPPIYEPIILHDIEPVAASSSRLMRQRVQIQDLALDPLVTDDLGSSHPLVEAHDGEASFGSDSSYTPFMLSDEESVEICSNEVLLEDIAYCTTS